MTEVAQEVNHNAWITSLVIDHIDDKQACSDTENFLVSMRQEYISLVLFYFIHIQRIACTWKSSEVMEAIPSGNQIQKKLKNKRKAKL